jgi:hypothetical protein
MVILKGRNKPAIFNTELKSNEGRMNRKEAQSSSQSCAKIPSNDSILCDPLRNFAFFAVAFDKLNW